MTARLQKFNGPVLSNGVGPRAVRRRGSACLPFASLRVLCDARPCGPVAELASFAALSALRHPRRVRGRCALRARPQVLRFSAAHSRPGAAPPSGPGTEVVGRGWNTDAVAGKVAGGTQAGRIGAAEKRRVPGRARSALREHTCGRLSERRERSERSEFGHRPGSRASQGTRSAAKGKPSEPRPRPTRRLARADTRARKRAPANSRVEPKRTACAAMMHATPAARHAVGQAT